MKQFFTGNQFLFNFKIFIFKQSSDDHLHFSSISWPPLWESIGLKNAMITKTISGHLGIVDWSFAGFWNFIHELQLHF